MSERGLQSPDRDVGVAGTSPPPLRSTRQPARAAERPALAADVELLGELQGSAFAERQWLVRRGDKFIQLSELLYRVAERLDGARTADEIAADVTAELPWHVTPENVRQIVERKLVPLGVVSTEGTSPARGRTEDVSPFRISGRRRLIRPAAVQRVSSALAPLFAPFVVVPALVLVVAMHIWLYVVHGAGNSIHLALYTPGGLLLVLGLMLASSFFHEFGHAAALRYGGGRPGAIGGGFYLVYPTLFTNTSDAYRLSRSARLRTDLGGMYFQLLFALAVTALAVAIDSPVLLALVVVVDLEIVYQFLPSARLDGYWAVADALGVPDPLSQARLAVLDPKAAPAARPATVKPWVSAALAVYLTLSLAFVTATFALTVADLPQIVSKSATIFRHHGAVFHEAINRHEFLVAAAVATQLALLALIVVALCLLVYRGTRAVVGTLASWSARSRERRVGGAAIAASLITAVALLWSTGFFWAPPLPVPSGSRTTAPDGTRTFHIASTGAVAGRISYRQHPPVGGRYSPQWQNCGFYAAPVADARAVHSLARGAVWIAYSPRLSKPERVVLHAVAQQLPFVLVSQYRGLRSRVVLSAWGRQLALGSLSDPRLGEFIAAFRLSSDAPEAGKPCTGGVGTPAR